LGRPCSTPGASTTGSACLTEDDQLFTVRQTNKPRMATTRPSRFHVRRHYRAAARAHQCRLKEPNCPRRIPAVAHTPLITEVSDHLVFRGWHMYPRQPDTTTSPIFQPPKSRKRAGATAASHRPTAQPAQADRWRGLKIYEQAGAAPLDAEEFGGLCATVSSLLYPHRTSDHAGLVPGIHACFNKAAPQSRKDVDGRDKPAIDDCGGAGEEMPNPLADPPHAHICTENHEPPQTRRGAEVDPVSRKYEKYVSSGQSMAGVPLPARAA